MRISILFVLFFGCCFPLWSQYFDQYAGNGQPNGITVSSSGAISSQHQASNTLAEFQFSREEELHDVSRFLSQASFGGSYDEIFRVRRIGYEGWFQEQFNLPPTLLSDRTASMQGQLHAGSGEIVVIETVIQAWWNMILQSRDQLRQRMAFSLSEIIVVGATSDQLFYAGKGISNFYDLFIKHAFGNYRDLLYDVSLHPVMGFYLSHYNNPKADPVNNIFPDENYAREIMQLFSIGIHELNMDGSLKLDSLGRPIPTYDNDDIKEFAKIFTGLGPGGTSGNFAFFGLDFTQANATVPMKMYPEYHQGGQKELLNGFQIAGGTDPLEEIGMAVDNVFNHPNCPPFVSKLLIQRLITSNPSPAYIERVAQVFVNNGKGERGDLQAVTKAILMDPEARSCEDRGESLNMARMREPIMRYAHFLRAFEVFNPATSFAMLQNPGFRFEYFTEQMVLKAPSVFNFFSPNYRPTGVMSDLELNGPEFQIHNSRTSIGYINEVDYWTFKESLMPLYNPIYYIQSGIPLPDDDYNSVELELDDLLRIASNRDGLLDRLDLILTHGTLSKPTRQTIFEALGGIEEDLDRVHMAIYLIMISPDYVILH
ncbi:MAG: DUF1800 domain-containing protein [Bacteroidota bacterium]